MSANIKGCFLQPAFSAKGKESKFTMDVAGNAQHFHQTIPGYKPTELKDLSALAEKLGIAAIRVKDESSRFGLNAFKALGGSYCIAKYLGKTYDIPDDELSQERILALKKTGVLDQTEVCTATDGNHGRGVAWAANQLGIGCHVYMPKGSALERLENIRKQNAIAEITDVNYDDTVRLAAKMTKENGWVLMQDTVVDGKEEIPEWLMQGYLTMAAEIAEQWQGEAPTHIFLQAGVGSMAGAMAVCLHELYKDANPRIFVVESDRADCLYQTALAGDGNLHIVEGALDTIMAGLACGEPCSLAWDLLAGYADGFLSVSDEFTVSGMQHLATPYGADPVIVSGESGAVTTGIVIELMENEAFSDMKEKIGLDADSRVLTISTEGATDRENYKAITGKEPIM